MSVTSAKVPRAEGGNNSPRSPARLKPTPNTLGVLTGDPKYGSRFNLNKAPSSSINDSGSQQVLGEPSLSTLPVLLSKPKLPEPKHFDFKQIALGKISEDTRSDEFRADVELLYLPKEMLSQRAQHEQSVFLSFHELKKTEAYRKKKELLAYKSDSISSLSRRLGFNGQMKHKYLDFMTKQSSATYSQVVKNSADWDKKKFDRVKIIKRNPFGKVEDINDTYEIAQLPSVQPRNMLGVFGAAVNVFFSDEERRSYIKNYQFAWYPCVEPVYKEAECLEGSSATVVEENIFVIGGFTNSSQKIVFQFNPSADTVKTLDCSGSVPKCILYHTAVALQQQIFVFGGDVGIGVANSKMTSNELWKFDTRFLEWKKIKSQKTPEPRKYHAACEFGSYMLVSGGVGEDSETPFSDFHAYSPETEEWTQIQHEVEWSGLSHHTMVPVYNTKVKSLYGKPAINGHKHKSDSGDMINEGLFIFGGLKPREQPSNELIMVDTSQKPWRRRKIQPLGQGPKEVYDHCSHYIRELRLMLVYGGRNHKLFEARGRMALGELYVLNVNYLVWSHLNIPVPNGLHIERYSFNSVLHDHKLIIFGGLTDQNFAGFNVGRLELVESEARLVKSLKPDQKYPDLVKDLVKKRKQLEIRADKEELENIAKKQNSSRLKSSQPSEQLDEYSSSAIPIHEFSNASGLNDSSVISKPVPEVSLPVETSPLKRSPTMFRGFAALPDAFLDVMNQKSTKRAVAPMFQLQPVPKEPEPNQLLSNRSRQVSALGSKFSSLPKLKLSN